MLKRDINILILAVFLFTSLFYRDIGTFYAKRAYARGDSETALLLNYKDANLAMMLGNYYFNGGEYDLKKAEQSYLLAVKLDRKILWGHYQLARIYFVRNDMDLALEEINKELTENPENLRSLYVRGLIYGFEKKYGNAEADFRRFVAWAPAEWAGYNDLAWILAKEGKYEDAERIIETAMQIVSGADENPWLLNTLGVAQLNLKKYADAKKTFELTLNLSKKMSKQQWLEAYPGNDPKEAEIGFEEFKRAVAANFRRAVDKDGI